MNDLDFQLAISLYLHSLTAPLCSSALSFSLFSDVITAPVMRSLAKSGEEAAPPPAVSCDVYIVTSDYSIHRVKQIAALIFSHATKLKFGSKVTIQGAEREIE